MDQSQILTVEMVRIMPIKIKRTKGFTVAELLISLAITAMILAAIATAFDASASNYQQNQAIYEANNGCRQALAKITQELRGATAVDPDTNEYTCSFLSASGESLTYYYLSLNAKLYVLTESGIHVVCDNVTDASFTKSTAVDAHGLTYVKSVQISMTVASGDITATMPAAVVIRKNLN